MRTEAQYQKDGQRECECVSETDFSGRTGRTIGKDDAGTDRSVEGETECYGRRTI